jgi:thiamine phosphate synthase YjbQ (UPF0047 family)|tara:strand:+ start:1166 stop:1372 length:207 start_codon:yes stop_codon:yes gene_type:complete
MMAITIDKRSKYSTYIKTGSLTIYVEHSPNCAEDFVSVWENNSTEDEKLFHTNFDFENNKRHIEGVSQ